MPRFKLEDLDTACSEDVFMRRQMGLFLSLAATTLSGCASIMNPGPDKVSFKSDPSGATIYLDGKNVGQAPAIVAVPRKAGSVKMSLPGYEETSVPIKRTANGWIYADVGLIFISPLAGCIGAMIDCTSGNDKVAAKEMTVTMYKAN
jgi:uncharacterized protein YceK